MTKEEIQRINAWLPKDTQSIVVSRGNFKLFPPLGLKDIYEKSMLMSQKKEQWWQSPLMPAEDQFHFYCSVAPNFNEICEKKLYEVLQKRNINLAVKIFRQFTPDQFALEEKTKWHERACNIVFFDSDKKTHDEFVALLEKYCTRKFDLENNTVYECDEDNIKSRKKSLSSFEKFLDAERNHYIAQGDFEKAKKVEAQYPRKANFRAVLISIPQQGIMLSTLGDVETLSIVLKSGRAPNKQNKFFDIPEWKFVKEDSKIFGIRHFPFAGKVDPSSPLNSSQNKNVSSAAVDPEAIGFVLNMSPNELEYLYLSDSDNLKSIYPNLFPVSNMNGDLQKDGIVAFQQHKINMKVKGNTKAGSLSPWQARFWLGQLR